jgi:lipoprotein signal peptidase
MFAGATGNLIDRAFSARGVVDFIGPYDLKFMRWPVFNFADVWVVAGTFAFAIVAARPHPKPGAPAQEQVL